MVGMLLLELSRQVYMSPVILYFSLYESGVSASIIGNVVFFPHGIETCLLALKGMVVCFIYNLSHG